MHAYCWSDLATVVSYGAFPMLQCHGELYRWSIEISFWLQPVPTTLGTRCVLYKQPRVQPRFQYWTWYLHRFQMPASISKYWYPCIIDMYKTWIRRLLVTNPSQAASCSGVWPFLPLLRLQSAPWRNSSSHTSTWLQNTAQCSGVSPRSSASLTSTGAVECSSSSNSFTSPRRAILHNDDI